LKYLVRMRDIHKYFGKVAALRGVDFDVGSNEVVGLVGDNGAGKSTLMKILSGLFPPDRGEIVIKGTKVGRDYSVLKARKFGIETVYQEKALADNLTVWRNIFSGRMPTNRLGFIRTREAKEIANAVMGEMLGSTGRGVSADWMVATMSGGEKQGVAIGRALHFNADLIILDEPIAGLSVAECMKVAEFVRRIKESGRSCVYVSHTIHHLYPISDRFVILHAGRKVKEIKKREASAKKIENELARISMGGKT